MRRATSFILLCLLCLFFCSCEHREYRADIDSAELARALAGEISADDEYLEYSEEDISFLPFFDGGLDISVLYSRDSTDVGEIGVVRCEATEAEAVAKEIEDYLKSELSSKSAFLKTYAPEEITKLEEAKVTRYGGYIVYTILNSEDTVRVFEKAEEMLG